MAKRKSNKNKAFRAQLAPKTFAEKQSRERTKLLSQLGNIANLHTRSKSALRRLRAGQLDLGVNAAYADKLKTKNYSKEFDTRTLNSALSPKGARYTNAQLKEILTEQTNKLDSLLSPKELTSLKKGVKVIGDSAELAMRTAYEHRRNYLIDWEVYYTSQNDDWLISNGYDPMNIDEEAIRSQIESTFDKKRGYEWWQDQQARLKY